MLYFAFQCRCDLGGFRAPLLTFSIRTKRHIVRPRGFSLRSKRFQSSYLLSSQLARRTLAETLATQASVGLVIKHSSPTGLFVVWR